MKIAIHNREKSFSERWIEYCKNNTIEYVLVNAYENDIIQQIKGCDAFMWHFSLSFTDKLFAKQLIYSLEKSGIKCFPSFNTMWHFDDKVGQKYLLESIKAPLVPSYVFYSKQDALQWVDNASFPKVFKLRGGAGSSNVKLVTSKQMAKKIINRAFGKGFDPVDYGYLFQDALNKFFHKRARFYDVLKYLYLFFKEKTGTLLSEKQKGYVYFQEFVPNNSFDIRVVVVGDRAFALKRMARDGDFRASGSGKIIYEKQQIDERCVQIAFEVNNQMSAQSAAFDFVFNEDNMPMIVEVSYGYTASAYDYCEGYWSEDMKWHDGSNFDFCGWMVNNMITNH